MSLSLHYHFFEAEIQVPEDQPAKGSGFVSGLVMAVDQLDAAERVAQHYRKLYPFSAVIEVYVGICIRPDNED